MRADLALISEWIEPDTRVLDLACGDGTLLSQLQTKLNVTGYGIEIDSAHIVECLEKGVNVIQTDLDAGLSGFDENSFDYVIMTQSLQTMHFPQKLLTEMLRVGRQGIVSFPNFGHWRNRLRFALGGKMPKSQTLPYEWYNTPNIHLCTLNDFEILCENLNIEILQYVAGNLRHKPSPGLRLLPNLLCELAMYRFKKSKNLAKESNIG